MFNLISKKKVLKIIDDHRKYYNDLFEWALEANEKEARDRALEQKGALGYLREDIEKL